MPIFACPALKLPWHEPASSQHHAAAPLVARAVRSQPDQEAQEARQKPPLTPEQMVTGQRRCLLKPVFDSYYCQQSPQKNNQPVSQPKGTFLVRRVNQGT